MEKSTQERKKRLELISQNVPYYNSIQNITSNVRDASTEARRSDIFQPFSIGGLKEFQAVGNAKLHSFSENKIFSDQKFRLADALHQAGVARSKYAGEIVKQIIPRQVERTTGIQPH